MADQIDALRLALQHSPENVPLRCHLAEVLLAHGRADEAATEYRAALALDPDNAVLKTGLAGAFWQAGKKSEGLVVLEDVLQKDNTPAEAYVLHAHMLLQEGDPGRAARQYRRALELNPELADQELADRLGVHPEQDETAHEVVDGRMRQGMEDGAPETEFVSERPDIDFSDVGGMEGVKDEIQKKIILPQTRPDLFAAYGKKAGGGILLYGPPGCGKTHLARATAGEVQAGFLAIGLHDVLDMWIGNSEKNLHAIFNHARGNTPAVLFFDEVDALGASRSDMRQSSSRHLINQFLSELDGVEHDNEGVLILAATNAPWHLDTAFRRPGRFDRMIFVPPPDLGARAEIYRILLRDKPVRDIDHQHVAKKTKGFSGADLKGVVDRAIEAKLDEALAAGEPQPLTTKDLVAAAKRAKPTTREWFATARNYAMYANQGGVYDDVLEYLDAKHD